MGEVALIASSGRATSTRPLRLAFAGETHVGKIREGNEDRVALLERADGDAGERGNGGALRREALERTRVALARAHGVRGALERLLEALGAGEEGALRKSTEELSVRRRTLEGALVDAQELADRAVDSMSKR